MEVPELIRHQIRRTTDSFYECISVAIYGNTQRAKYIRTALWDAFSVGSFGCNVSSLAEHIAKSVDEEGYLPQGPLHAWKFVGAMAWMKTSIVGEISKHAEISFQNIFSNPRNQKALAQYIIRSSMNTGFYSDVRIVGQTLCDCFNVGLVAFSTKDLGGKPATFYPHSKLADESTVPDESLIYIHMIKDGAYWDLLMEKTKNTRCVPKHVIHTLVEKNLVDQNLEYEMGLEELRELRLGMPANSVYQIKVFDGRKRKTSHVGHMTGPTPPNRVHYLDVDAKNVKAWWLFILYKEPNSPTEQFSDSNIWIFARKGDAAYWISVWKKDLTRPTFLLNVDETAVYVVKADDKETAAAFVRKECAIDVYLTLPK